MSETGQRVVLHIGLDKTGTTALQAFCSAYREDLRRHGFVYPVPLHFPDHHLDLAERFGFSWSDVTGAGADDPVLRHYAEQIRSDPATVVLSSEHFCFYSDIRALENLRGWLAGVLPDHRITIALYLRNQVEWLISLYAESIKWGYEADIEQFYATARSRLRFGALLADWGQVFGAESVVAFDYDAERDTVGRFLHVLGAPPDVLALDRSPPRSFSNPTLPQVVNEAIRRIDLPVGREAMYDAIVAITSDSAYLQAVADPGPVWVLPRGLLDDLPDLQGENRQICADLRLDRSAMLDLAAIAGRYEARLRQVDRETAERAVAAAEDAFLAAFAKRTGR